MPSVFAKILFLFWFKEVKRMWRSKINLLAQWCAPSAITCMVIAVFVAGFADKDDEFTAYTFPDWKAQTDVGKSATDTLWYISSGYTDNEVESILTHLYNGDAERARRQTLRYHNYTQMQDDLYKVGDLSLQADYTLVLSKDATGQVTYDLQTQVGKMRQGPFEDQAPPSNQLTWTKKMSNLGIFSFQLKLAEALSASDTSFNVTLQRYPQETPGNTNKAIYTLSREGSWSQVGPPFWGVSLITVVVSTTKSMVQDREMRIRQSLNLIGVGGVAYRTVYALRNLVVTGVAALPPLLVYQAVNLFYESDIGLVYLVNLLFIIQATSFSSFLSLFLRKSQVASLVALVMYCAGVALGSYAVMSVDSKGFSLVSCLVPSSFLTVFTTTIWELENKHSGLRWDSLYTEVGNYPSVGNECWFAIISILLYEVATWYLEHVMPSVLGNSQPWNFPFMPKAAPAPEADIERPSLGNGAILSARNIMKEFPLITAVRDVSIDIFPGEVLSLLGHNGAGKTCTISMITGTMPATSGTIYYDNKPNNTQELQKVLGLCPQHDILFDCLTTRDHLVLMGALKGVPFMQLGKEADRAMEEVGVAMKSKALATSLSGGQKRKLSVAMAFLGGSKVVLLDEPTAGMDPAARRHIWELIEQKKAAGVGIILTTHFMDEADLLGDKVAIMHSGLIKDSGTPLELKKKYGKGYSLIVAFSPTAELGKITDMVRRHIPAATITSTFGGEVMYTLPDTPQLPDLLDDMTKCSYELGIVSHGLSMTTLEEVFLRLETSSQIEDGVDTRTADCSVADVVGTKAGYFTVLYALMYKRYCCAKRDQATFVFVMLFPFIFIIAGLIIRKLVNRDPDPPTAINLGLEDYYTGMVVGTVDDQMEATLRGMLAPLPASTFWPRGAELLDVIRQQDTAVGFNVTDLTAASSNTVLLYNATMRYAAMAGVQMWAFSNIGAGVNGTITDMPMSPWELSMTGDMVFAICIAVAMSFVPSSYAAFVIREKASGALNLQLASGVTKFQYYVTTYLFDCLQTFVSMSLQAVVLAVSIGGYELWCLYLSMLLYGVSVTWLAYLVARVYKDEGGAQANISGWLIFLAFSFVVADLSVQASTGPGSGAAKLLPVIFASINPTYAAAKCAMLAVNFMGSADYFKDEYNTTNYLDYNLMGQFHLILAYQLVGYAFLLCVSEVPLRTWVVLARVRSQQVISATFGSSSKLINGRESQDNKSYFGVSKEQTFVEAGGDRQTAILVRGIRKEFKKDMVAIDDLYLSIPVGCFGLLGSNGAGKTTLIKILTGEIPPTKGDAVFKPQGMDLSILSDRTKINGYIGLCPQFDAILGEMSGEEMIHFFCLLKGVATRHNADYVKLVGLTGQEKRPCGTYSGGNKRKLSVCLALMGAPDIVFLDEPSTGVDPKSRRVLWDVVKYVARKRTVVLTTHSMEEVDALSSRIAIMKTGTLQCVGTPQEIRSALSCGYTLSFAVQSEAHLTHAIGSLQQVFPKAVVEDSHGAHVTLSIPEVTPSVLLRTLQGCAGDLAIVEYAISQTTLEQIFVNIVEEKATGGAPT
eukprot:TRINITY_DN562_c0_g1_i1.p1 TRINITY_DN562_c0_g1~~TRINITY_DN562_c0_g1_i1.p1  ORF type:complete len:1555 (+),score=489.84 TRINITY_DN562_c0_g1_i1:48-4712(+)